MLTPYRLAIASIRNNTNVCMVCVICTYYCTECTACTVCTECAVQYEQYVQYVQGFTVCSVCSVCTVCTECTVAPSKWNMIEHRFGHRSSQDESSGQSPAAILNVFVFRVYLVFSETGKNNEYGQILASTDISKKVCRFSTKQKTSCSAVNRVWGYQYISKYRWYWFI